MKELTRFEFAAVKRVAANTKSLRTKVEKIDAKIAELMTQRDNYVAEVRMWESPIVEKYGCSVESILDGSYLDAPTEDVVYEDIPGGFDETVEVPSYATTDMTL